LKALLRFRRLVDAAILATFLLVVVGGVVRVSESGLGCGPAGSGLRGWPLCEGRLVPGADPETAIEYTHRVLATVVVVLLVAIVWQAARRFRDRRGLLAAGAVAVALVLFQAVLGGLTVEHGLDSALVAAHLGAAMLLLAVLIWISAAARAAAAQAAAGPSTPAASPRPPAPGATARRAPLAAGVVACALLLATIVAGGVIAGTERHGAHEPGDEAGAHYACGMEFPTCNGAFLPFGEAKPIDIHLAHRGLMFLAVAAIAAFALLLARAGAGRPAAAIAAVLAVQVALGALNVWLAESQLLVLAHLTVATALWVLVVWATVLCARGAAPPGVARPPAGAAAPGPPAGKRERVA
jgi:heme A synthase